ncbi:MAG: 23S rRNA (guanosine(2251)-2'-O)-methyltransferase RlmB, partial [Clostridia bacterium]|nr:23S rRNA (guanosine(2251)-2'-O)-methyltransferase RlmB [Clostridia bacterium]
DTYSGELSDMITHLKSFGYRFAIAEADAEKDVYSADLSYPLILAVGGEKRGFSKAITEMADLRISLPYGRDFPMALSAASAATVLAFEAARQNR